MKRVIIWIYIVGISIFTAFEGIMFLASAALGLLLPTFAILFGFAFDAPGSSIFKVFNAVIPALVLPLITGMTAFLGIMLIRALYKNKNALRWTTIAFSCWALLGAIQSSYKSPLYNLDGTMPNTQLAPFSQSLLGWIAVSIVLGVPLLIFLKFSKNNTNTSSVQPSNEGSSTISPQEVNPNL